MRRLTAARAWWGSRQDGDSAGGSVSAIASAAEPLGRARYSGSDL